MNAHHHASKESLDTTHHHQQQEPKKSYVIFKCLPICLKLNFQYNILKTPIFISDILNLFILYFIKFVKIDSIVNISRHKIIEIDTKVSIFLQKRVKTQKKHMFSRVHDCSPPKKQEYAYALTTWCGTYPQ